MSVVALGRSVRVVGFRLAGVTAVPVNTREEVVDAWDRLQDDVELLLLTAEAAEVLGDRLEERPRLLWAVLP